MNADSSHWFDRIYVTLFLFEPDYAHGCRHAMPQLSLLTCTHRIKAHFLHSFNPQGRHDCPNRYLCFTRMRLPEKARNVCSHVQLHGFVPIVPTFRRLEPPVIHRFGAFCARGSFFKGGQLAGPPRRKHQRPVEWLGANRCKTGASTGLPR